jgi:cytochrome c-type biogenesis protein CcmH
VIGRILVAALIVLGAAGTGAAQHAATPIDDREAHEIAAELRCVVCQNLSVADSPSEMAQQMRAIVRERLAMGERREEVLEYFVDRYGEWILLSPRRSGFTLLVWIFPVVAVTVGLAVAGILVTGWRRRGDAERAQAQRTVDPALRDRIRREMDTGDA